MKIDFSERSQARWLHHNGMLGTSNTTFGNQPIRPLKEMLIFTIFTDMLPRRGAEAPIKGFIIRHNNVNVSL